MYCVFVGLADRPLACAANLADSFCQGDSNVLRGRGEPHDDGAIRMLVGGTMFEKYAFAQYPML